MRTGGYIYSIPISIKNTVPSISLGIHYAYRNRIKNSGRPYKTNEIKTRAERCFIVARRRCRPPTIFVLILLHSDIMLFDSKRNDSLFRLNLTRIHFHWDGCGKLSNSSWLCGIKKNYQVANDCFISFVRNCTTTL